MVLSFQLTNKLANTKTCLQVFDIRFTMNCGEFVNISMYIPYHSKNILKGIGIFYLYKGNDTESQQELTKQKTERESDYSTFSDLTYHEVRNMDLYFNLHSSPKG